MENHFNTAGPGIPALHYLIDPLSRNELDEIESLIDQQRYFVLHVPQQTGKTSCLLALRDHLTWEQRMSVMEVTASGRPVLVLRG